MSATHCPQGHAYTPENTYSSRTTPKACRTCRRVRNREAKHAARLAAIAHLGGACPCGVTDTRCLQLDHIDGGGRADHQRRGSLTVYRAAAAGEPGFQVLCANCHAIKTAAEHARRRM